MFENKKIQNLFLNEEKVEDLIRRYYSDIYKYCFFHLGNRETAEDITQEVFLKFLKSFPRIGAPLDSRPQALFLIRPALPVRLSARSVRLFRHRLPYFIGRSFNIFHRLFNISTLLNFSTTECFNNSTSFQQSFQYLFLSFSNVLTFKFICFQLFHVLYYYDYNKLYIITRARVRAYARARVRANKAQYST